MSKRMSILLLVAVSLAALMGLNRFVLHHPGEDEASAPVERPAAGHEDTPRQPTPDHSEFLPPLSGYGTIWARPVFSPARRQAAVIAGPRTPTGPARASDQPPAFKIVGVAIGPAGSAALVRMADRTVKRHYINDIIDGWIIEQIDPQNVTVMRDAERWQLPVGATQ